MFSEPRPPQGPDRGESPVLQFVGFRLADEDYAIAITKIQEIILMKPITRLPQSPAFIEGLNAHLAVSDWIAGDSYSFADITALVTVDFAARAGLDTHGCGDVARWYKAASARPSAEA